MIKMTLINVMMMSLMIIEGDDDYGDFVIIDGNFDNDDEDMIKIIFSAAN